MTDTQTTVNVGPAVGTYWQDTGSVYLRIAPFDPVHFLDAPEPDVLIAKCNGHAAAAQQICDLLNQHCYIPEAIERETQTAAKWRTSKSKPRWVVEIETGELAAEAYNIPAQQITDALNAHDALLAENAKLREALAGNTRTGDADMPEVTYTAAMLPACIAAVEARLKLCDAATPGPWEVSPMVDGATIGGNPHKVWPIDSPAQEDEDGFCGIGCAVCILPREDETPETLRYVPANADFIADARTGYPALLRMELARLELHRGMEADGPPDKPRPTGDNDYPTDGQWEAWSNETYHYNETLDKMRRDTARCWAQMQGRE